MALNAYLKLKGQKQGDIKGSVTQKGREGTILVFAVDHSIISPRDPASGLPTGKRMHKPIKITKEVDKASVPLYSALVTNENLPQWELKFWKPKSSSQSGTGTNVQYYTIKLTNANVASIHLVKPNTKDSTLHTLPDYEEVEFTYQKIEWTWTDGGVTAMDDWEAPIV
jgi:type VI secretion system secreted protein Hcp